MRLEAVMTFSKETKGAAVWENPDAANKSIYDPSYPNLTSIYVRKKAFIDVPFENTFRDIDFRGRRAKITFELLDD